jgi:hypothetical protein
MALACRDKLPCVPFPVERKYVEEAEAKLAVRFPAAFVARMMRSNGGEVHVAGETWWLFPFWDRTDRKRLSRTSNDVVRETNNAREMSWFPARGVAIASNGAGDHLLFLPATEEPSRLGPEVHCWRLHGGEIAVALEDPYELWERDRDEDS